MLVAVSGLPGVGKTTVSGLIADRLDAERLRSDVVRKELYDDPGYGAEETAAVYDALLDRARTATERGESVVLDATFRRRDQREAARDLAREVGVEFRFVHVVCDEAVVRERIAGREGDASDADFTVHRELREEFEPLEMDHLTVDNAGSLAETRRQVEGAF